MLRLLAVSFVCLLLIPAPLLCQWNWQNPIPQGNDLLEVQFIDSAFGWAVGMDGTILHTTTGGSSWYGQEFGRTDNILTISMVSEMEGWSAGDNGVIMHTTDGGDDWLDQNSGISSGINSLVFLNRYTGWAAGDKEIILHTTDGGQSWSIQHQSGGAQGINSLWFNDLLKGWAVGSNHIVYRTTDAGSTWIPQTVGTGSISFFSVSFVDSLLGFVTGSGGAIYRTSDGGTTWATISSGVTTGLNQIIMQNSLVGWIVGDNGVLLKTVNGGVSWANSSLTSGEDLNGLTRLPGELWAVGEFGRILQSTNNGFSWFALDSGSRLSANWIDFPTASVGYAVGQTGLIDRSTDGGITWNLESSPVPSVSCYGVKFTDATHGWAVGDNGTILRTTDGSTWATETSPVSHTLFGIAFPNAASGWIVGGEFITFTGAIIHTTNSGNSWTTQLTAVPQILYGIAFADPSNGWAMGENGLVLHTTNAGANWNTQVSGTSAALYWGAFPNASTGWIVGDSGIVLTTSDGGSTWRKQNSGVTELLYSITAAGPSHLLACGDFGTVIETTDGGTNWDPAYSRTQNSLFGIASVNDTLLWASGDYGTILKYTVPPPTVGFVSGTVFFDKNNNHQYNAGEPGLPGWTVILNGPVTDTAITASDGSFSFDLIPLGNYTLQQVTQPTWGQTMPASLGGYSFSLNDSSGDFIGNFGNYSPNEFSFSVPGRWNMLSVPLTSDDMSKLTLLPTATSPAFRYQNNYLIADSLHHGVGYWVKFGYPQPVLMSGTPLHSDSIPVLEGWNLVGSVADSFPVSAVTTTPSGILASNFFSYQGSYSAANVIIPGGGYWIKTSGAGTIIMNSAAVRPFASGERPAKVSEQIDPEQGRLDALTFSISDHEHGTLYLDDSGEDSLLASGSGLPPKPPADAFDVRFENDYAVHTFNGKGSVNSVRIEVQTNQRPVELQWKFSDPSHGYRLSDPANGKFSALLTQPAGTLKIPAGISVLSISDRNAGQSGGEIPAEFSLLQNNPNPFNPSTTIRFGVPLRSHVSVTVFNLLGQRVTTLVDGLLDPGYHAVTWNAAVASGVYFCRMTATPLSGNGERFEETRKLILMK